MSSLSAVGALRPAFERTRELLFRPLVWGRFVVITLVAMIFGSSFELPDSVASRLHLPAGPIYFEALHGSHFSPVVGVWFAACMFVLGTPLLIFVLLIAFRMPFMLFDLVSGRRSGLRELWIENGAAAWEWFVFNVCWGVAAFLCMTLLSVAVKGVFAGGVVPLVWLRAGRWIAAGSTLLYMVVTQEFVIAALVLDGGTALDALGKAISLMLSMPLETLKYLVARVSLIAVRDFLIALSGFVGGWIFLRGADALLMDALARSTDHGVTYLTVSLVLAGMVVLLFCAAYLLVLAVVGGTLEIFFVAYAMYFLAGRYPLLRELMDDPGSATIPLAFPPRKILGEA